MWDAASGLYDVTCVSVSTATGVLYDSDGYCYGTITGKKFATTDYTGTSILYSFSLIYPLLSLLILPSLSLLSLSYPMISLLTSLFAPSLTSLFAPSLTLSSHPHFSSSLLSTRCMFGLWQYNGVQW